MLLEAYRNQQVDFRQCTGCELCVQLCRAKAIEMKENGEGFLYPDVNDDRCVRCGMCAIHCPVLKPIVAQNYNTTMLYSGYEKSLEYQKKCSSGGIFGLLANRVLQLGGAVFGAVFDSSTKTVVHVSSDEYDLNDIFRSKYVQSRIGNTYKRVKEILTTTDRKVLFCGTPCQVEGLLRFLNKGYENLITVDFVCHGVPSPGVFRAMLESEEKINKSTIRNITFREKDPSGKGEEHLYLYLDNGRKIEYKSQEYYYYYLFLYNCILRYSCMTCTRAENHKADLTLADDWLQKWQKDPSIGVSLICVNTNKGNDVFAALRDELIVQQVNSEERAIISQAHRYSEKDRRRTLQRYCKTQNVNTLKRMYRYIRFRNEGKKNALYVLSKCYRTIVPRREGNGKK